MTTIPEARTVSLSIHRSADEVYAFISEVENFPRWSAFVKSVKKEGSEWMFETTEGLVRVRFATKNKLRVLDHYVTGNSRVTVYVPIRVVANGADACEVIFTIFRQTGMSDQKFSDDVAMVVGDLQSLKRLLENAGATVEQEEESHFSRS